MQHLLPLYLAFSILPGIAALTVLSTLASRLKKKALTLYLIAYSCLTVNVLENLVMFYLGINISEQITPGLFALISLNIPFSILMHIATPLAVNEVTRPPGKRWIDLAFILTGLIELAVYYTPLVMRYSRESQTIFLGPLYPFVAIIQIALLSYSVGVIVIRRKTIADASVRRYILTLVIILAVFLPAIAYDQFLFRGAEVIDTVPITVILHPLFYAVLSLATLFFGIRYMMSTANQAGPADPLLQAGTEVSPDSIMKKLADESALSEREVAVVRLIAQGLGNKQIALELHISAKTVGNHIYNIYRKLNITSRYELLALLK